MSSRWPGRTPPAMPRLNPLARTLTLTFTHAAEQATIELQLP
jgi:hypothetical protein